MTRVAEGIYSRELASGKRVFDLVYELPRRTRGKRNQRWERGFPSLGAAKARRAEVMIDRRRGTYVEPTKVTLGEFMMGRFEARHDLGAIRATTFDGYRRHLENHVIPEVGGIRIQELTTSDLNELWAKKARDGRLDGRGGLGAKTIHDLNYLISQTLSDAQAQGLVFKNVAIGVDLPRRTRRQFSAWSAEEVRRFLEAVGDDRDYALYHLDLTTGMRRGELLGLKWKRLDLDAAEIVVAETIVPVGHSPTWSVPKTDAGFRTLPLDKGTVVALREHRKRQLEERLAFGSSYTDLDLVFPNPDGAWFNPENLSKRFDRRVAGLDVQPIRFHDLRHTYATLARRGGIDIKVLSDRLGHASVVTTINLYQHVPIDMAQQAAQSIADFIFG